MSVLERLFNAVVGIFNLFGRLLQMVGVTLLPFTTERLLAGSCESFVDVLAKFSLLWFRLCF